MRLAEVSEKTSMSYEDPTHSLSADPQPSETFIHSADDVSLAQTFGPLTREIEENIELYFSELASAADTYSGELYDDETHASFYVASREVISQGLRNQLGFLRDNAPQAFALLVSRSLEQPDN